MKIIVGAGGKVQEGWVSLEKRDLDITNHDDFHKYMHESIDNILAEHVFEHLTLSEVKTALANIHEFLSYKGMIRIAVPDGYHPDQEYIDYVKPNGTGAGSESHQMLFNYQTLTSLLDDAGFDVNLLEWWDENHQFHTKLWLEQEGNVERCLANDPRNWDGKPHYTSLIVDGYKDGDTIRPNLRNAFAFIEKNDVNRLSPFNRKKTLTLYELARLAPEDGVIVELGAYHGNGTSSLWYGAWDGNVNEIVAVDAFTDMRGWANEPYKPDDKRIWLENMKKFNIEVGLLQMDVTQAAQIWKKPIALLVHDLGTKKRMLDDIKMWEKFVMKKGMIALRDLDDYSMGTEETVQYLLSTKNWGHVVNWDGFITSITRIR